MKPITTICLFGNLSVTHDRSELLVHTPPKVRELFAYLVLHRGRSHSREALAALFWKEASPANSKKYFRQAFWQLRVGLSVRGDAGAARLLRSVAGCVRFDSDHRTWIDVAEFELLATTPPSAKAIQSLDRAIRLYRGDLLDGCYRDWCLHERDRLRQLYLATLDELVNHCEQCGDFKKGIAYASCALATEAAREISHRAMMRLYYKIGDRAAALHQFERCKSTVWEELQAEPDDETQRLAGEIRAGRRLHTKSDLTKSDLSSLPLTLTQVNARRKAAARLGHRPPRRSR
jgi:DNA-binding SARP family transcriptional activator